MKQKIALLGFVGIVACTGTSGSDGPPASVPACGSGAILSASPITLSDLSTTGIVALGNLNPPDHTFPSNHLYFYLKDSDPQVSGVDNVPVYAPTDITITNIASTANESSGKTDYSITYYPCSQLQGFFDHVASLSTDLKSAFDAGSGPCTTYNPGSGNYTRCEKGVTLTVSAGVQIGTAGGPTTASMALDVGMYDNRIAALQYANDARVRTSAHGYDDFHVVCALDYYDSTLKAQLEAKLDRVATGLPLCGTVNQDLAATAQGRWFTSDAASPFTTESGNLALVHSNGDPSIPVFSIGNSTLGVGTITFTPAAAGTTNRDFANVTADGNLYCYNTLSTPGVIFLLQMTNATTLKIEKQTAADCTGAPTFTSAVMTFIR